MTGRHCKFRRSGLYASLTQLILLVCATAFINDFRVTVQSTESYVAATRFRPRDVASSSSQRGRRLHASEAGTTGSRATNLGRSSADGAELRRAQPVEGPCYSATAGAGERKSDAQTDSAKVAPLKASGAGVGVTAAEQRRLGVSDNVSLLNLYNVTRQRPQAVAAEAPSASVSQLKLHQPQSCLKNQTSEMYSTENPAARDTTVIESEALPATTTKHFESTLRTESAQGAPGAIVTDEGTVDVRTAAPPLVPSFLPGASPSIPEHETLASLSSQMQSPTSAVASVPPGSSARLGEGGFAGEAALQWEELSRQHQQMLLSRNLTSVIKLFVDFTQPDQTTPWQMQPPRRCTGSAFVVEGRLLLTNGHLVDWQTRVLARRHGNAKKFTASVVAVAHDCDLALLTVANEEFWEGLQPLAFGSIPQLRDTVTLLGYPTGGDQLSITEGVVSRVGMSKYVHSGYELLTVQIDAAINPGNSGGPALVGGKVVGVAFQGFSELQSIGYIVPYPIIRHFLNDLALHQRFTGFPTLGIKVANLENQGFPAVSGMREYKKLANIKASDLPKGVTPSGVIVVEVDSLRKERYLKGQLRLPYSSMILPPDARIKRLLPEDPALRTAPPSLPHVAAPTLETAVSSQSFSPSVDGGVTMVPPAKSPSLPGFNAGASSLLSTSVEKQQLGAPSALGHGAADITPLQSTSPFVPGALPPLQEQLVQRERQDVGRSQPKEQKEERQRLPLPGKGEKAPTSENDLLVPNVHYRPELAVDPKHVGLKVGDVILAIDGIDVADDGTVPFRSAAQS